MKVPTHRAIAEGIHYAIKNADRFFQSAQVLLESKFFQDSYLLSLYALEEMGKIIVISNCLYYSTNSIQWELWLKKFRDHEQKFWFSKDLEDLSNKVIPLNKNKREKKNAILKQAVSYVNFKGDKFYAPDVISEEDAISMLETVKNRLKILKKNHPSVEHDEKGIGIYEELNKLSPKELMEKVKKHGFDIKF